MTNKQRKKCNSIIHITAVAAGSIGAGLAQIPGSDNAIIVPIQVTMTISLGAVFGVDLDESSAKAVLATATATQTGRAISQFFISGLPIAGNIINAATAIVITESIGWAVAKTFDK